MNYIDYKDVVKIHKDKFGFEPIITGINFHDSDNILEKILESIEKNIPYVEPEVPKDVDV